MNGSMVTAIPRCTEPEIIAATQSSDNGPRQRAFPAVQGRLVEYAACAALILQRAALSVIVTRNVEAHAFPTTGSTNIPNADHEDHKNGQLVTTQHSTVNAPAFGPPLDVQ
jgi:hypothetical protein